MNDPKTPNQEPRRTSQPGKKTNEPRETPGTKAAPATEYEKDVPHTGEQPVAYTGKSGEGSYEGTREYSEGYEEFASHTSAEESVEKGKKIDPNEPSLKDAEQRAKRGQARVSRPSSESIH